MKNVIINGDLVQHFKGGLYTVIDMNTKHTETGEL